MTITQWLLAALLTLLGLFFVWLVALRHRHKWRRFEAPYSVNKSRVISHRTVSNPDYDDDNPYSPEDIDVEIDENYTEVWTETYQDRECATCGFREAKRSTAKAEVA